MGCMAVNAWSSTQSSIATTIAEAEYYTLAGG